MFSKKMTFEEKILLEILFSDQPIYPNSLKSLDLNKLIEIASTHLIIPSLYINILKKNIDKCFDVDFMKYLEYIYKINKNRNEQLINEIISISKLLEKNKIEFILLKGAALIWSGIYDDIGERMIGDIDFLIRKDDVLITEQILTKNGYKEAYENFFDFRHLPRRIHKSFLFAIEPHTELLSVNKYLNSYEIFKDHLKINSVNIPNYEKLIKHNIYSHQINDMGYKKCFQSYRNLYDTFKIIEKKNINTNKLSKNKIISAYLYFYQHLTKKEKIKFKSKLDLYSKSLIFIKNKFKIIYLIYLYLLNSLNKLSYMPKQITLIFLSKLYRNYILKKLKLSFRKIF